MSKYKFEAGNSYEPREFGGAYIAGIHVTVNNKLHANRIELYGFSHGAAVALRDTILEALHDSREAAFQAGRDSAFAEIKKLLG